MTRAWVLFCSAVLLAAGCRPADVAAFRSEPRQGVAASWTEAEVGPAVVEWGGAGGGGELGVMAGVLFNDGDPSIKDTGLEASIYYERPILPILAIQIRAIYTAQDVENPLPGGWDTITGVTAAAIAKGVLSLGALEVNGGGGIGYRFDMTDEGPDIDDEPVYLIMAGAKYHPNDNIAIGLEGGYELTEPKVPAGDLDLNTLVVRASIGLKF